MFSTTSQYLRVENGSHSFSLSPVVCLVLIVCIVAGLLGLGFVLMGQVVERSSTGVDVVVQLSGNDILVTLLDGESARQIVGLYAYIDGHQATHSRNAVVRDIPLGKPVVYPDIARGVTGYKFVIVEATFADGTTGIIEAVRVQFS